GRFGDRGGVHGEAGERHFREGDEVGAAVPGNARELAAAHEVRRLVLPRRIERSEYDAHVRVASERVEWRHLIVPAAAPWVKSETAARQGTQPAPGPGGLPGRARRAGRAPPILWREEDPMGILLSWLILTLAVWVTAMVLPGIHVKSFGSAIIVAAIFG